jgi:transposase
MKGRYTPSYRVHAVEKALNRSEDIPLKEIAHSLGVAYSTIKNWIYLARKQELEPLKNNEISNDNIMMKEKRAQNWNLEEKLNMIIKCGSLDESTINGLCREKGIYSHHIKQWKQDIVNGVTSLAESKAGSEVKTLKQENKSLKKELIRKTKALAETAALLVLKKKVDLIWGSEEDSLQ